MILFKKPAALEAHLHRLKTDGRSIGFIPTMGALHPGHFQLIHASQQEADVSVCSIFINPTQFNVASDFEKYPVALEADILGLETAGTDILFLPAVKALYPSGTGSLEQYNLGHLETVLEGKYRPGHFQGVCQVMNRLLHIVQPDHLFMGQKDYQQCMVLMRLLDLMKLKTVLHKVETIREPDGLAMSSRNKRLNESQRKKAVRIYESLMYIKKSLKPGDLSVLTREAEAMLTEADFKTDYVAIADITTLEPLTHWNGMTKAIALIAAFQEEVRLIDNMILDAG